MPSLSMSFLHLILLMIGTVCASAPDQNSSSSHSNGSTFSFAHDGFNPSSLNLINNHTTVSAGILTLDGGGSSFAGALYKEPISLLDPASGSSNVSFSSSFTFSSNAVNGSLAFVISPDSNLTDYNEAILFNSGKASSTLSSSKGLELAFNLRYTNELPVLEPYYWYWQATDLEYLLLSVELVDGSSSLFSEIVDAPVWNQSSQQPAACSSPAESGGGAHENPLFEYQVSVQYDASASLVSAVFALCPYNNDSQLVYTASLNLSDFLTNSMFVGFIATNNGSYNVSQWNFTTDPTSASVVDSTSKIRKGYVLGFSLMGLGIAALIILVVGAFWFWRKMKRARRLNVVTPADVCTASFATADPAIAMPTNIELNTVPDPKHMEQHNSTVTGAASASFQVSATASWLKPPTPR